MRALHEVADTRLLADVRPTLVDRGDHTLIDVDGDDVPAVIGELGREGQSHLAGPDDRDRPCRAGVTGPRRDLAWRAVAAGLGCELDRSSDDARRDRWAT